MPPAEEEEVQQQNSEGANVMAENDTTKRPGSKCGRKPDPVRDHFTETGPRNNSCKRAPVECNYCQKEFTASQAEIAALRSHLTFGCKQCPQDVRQQLCKRAAEQIDLSGAEDAAAAAAAGVQRKRQKLGSSSSSSNRQQQIGVYLAGSVHNELGPGQQKAAMQHFLRFLVCNNVSFRVSSSHVWC
jgi:hypothetical protein